MSNHSEQAHAGEIGGTTRQFSIVWIALLVLTAIEVLLAYIQVPLTLMLILLVGLSVIKAWLIIAWFMHLKYERFSLFVTLFPMLILCIVLLFIFMPDALRAMNLRTR